MGRIWLRAAISGALMLFLLYYLVDPRRAWVVLARAHWGYLAWLAVWITLDRLLMTYKWRLLLTCRGLELGFWPALKAYYLASFAGCFLPSTVGADALRILAVKGPRRPAEVVAASVVIERTLGFLAAVIAALIGLCLLTWLAISLPHSFLAWSLGLGGLLAGGVVFSLSNRFGRFLQWLEARLEGWGRLGPWLGKALMAYHGYREHGLILLWFLLLSLLEQSGPVVGTWLTALAFNIHLGMVAAAAVAPVTLLFTRVPVSVSGFGVVESLYVALFSLVGLGATDSFVLGLVGNIAVVVTTLPGAFFYLRSGLSQVGD